MLGDQIGGRDGAESGASTLGAGVNGYDRLGGGIDDRDGDG